MSQTTILNVRAVQSLRLNHRPTAHW